MHIYVDESGSFVPSGTKPGISLVGALVIPDGRRAKIFSKYAALRSRLPKHEGEVKGRLLNEDQVAEIVELLRRNEALLEIVAIDLNTHEPAEIEASKRELAGSMTRGLTDAHHPSVLAGAASLAKRINELTHPLFVQSTVMFELIRHVAEVGINYHAQRHPQELAKFFWTFDGKDNQRTTNWEKLWADVLMPILQSKTIAEPMGFFEFGDFQHFKRFETAPPDRVPRPEGSADTATDIRLLMTEHFSYSSDSEPGLELADIAVNAVRRAMIGNLQFSGWRGLPSLMVHRPSHYIRLVSLHQRPKPDKLGYEHVLRHFMSGGRNMLAPRLLVE
jgi:hypothetical protein